MLLTWHNVTIIRIFSGISGQPSPAGRLASHSAAVRARWAGDRRKIMTEFTYAGLTQLGRPDKNPGSPEEAVLERVPNPRADAAYVVRFTCRNLLTVPDHRPAGFCAHRHRLHPAPPGWWRASH